MERLLGRLLLLAGALVIVGSLLPWHTLRGFDIDLNIDGIDSPNNGWVTLVLGVVVASFGFRMVDANVRPRRTVLGVTVLTAIVSVWAIIDASNAEDDLVGDARRRDLIAIDLDRAYGQWVLVAGIVLAVAVAILLARRPRPQAEPASP